MLIGTQNSAKEREKQASSRNRYRLDPWYCDRVPTIDDRFLPVIHIAVDKLNYLSFIAFFRDVLTFSCSRFRTLSTVLVYAAVPMDQRFRSFYIPGVRSNPLLISRILQNYEYGVVL